MKHKARMRFLAVASVFAALIAVVGMMRPDLGYRTVLSLRTWAADFVTEKLTPYSGETEIWDMAELTQDSRVQLEQTVMLVNHEHPLPEDYQAEIITYQDTEVTMNAAAAEAYGDLAAAIQARYEDSLYISGSYRTYEHQRSLYLQDTEGTAAAPNASEHQTGLALDVYLWQFAGASLLKTEAGRYLNENCGQYGFIIRYPATKEHVTGYPYEPWHIRYVGQPHASYIMEQHLAMEEYFDLLEGGDLYQIGTSTVSRQSGNQIIMPKDFGSCSISPDNTGGYVITVEP